MRRPGCGRLGGGQHKQLVVMERKAGAGSSVGVKEGSQRLTLSPTLQPKRSSASNLNLGPPVAWVCFSKGNANSTWLLRSCIAGSGPQWGHSPRLLSLSPRHLTLS